MLRQRSAVRATRHERAASGRAPSSASTRRGAAARAPRRPPPRTGSSVVARPASRSRIAAVASRDETKHSYIPSPETGSIRPAGVADERARARPRSASPARRSGSRWPRRFSSSSGSSPCASHTRRRCSRSFGPSLCQPPTPTFAWSPFGNTQRVAAGDVGQLDHHAARVALARERRVRDVPLVGDAVDDAAAEPDRLAVIPFAPSAPTITSAANRSPRRDRHDVVRLDLDRHAFAHLHPALARRVEQERVEPPPLRHPDERLRSSGARPRRRSGSAARPGRPAPRRPASGRPGTGARRASSCPPPQGLSRGKRALSSEQHRRARPRRGGTRSSSRPARRRPRSRRSASRTGGYNARASRGCARAAKGNGL